MKFLALEQEIGRLGEGDFQPYLEDEARQVYALMQADIIREIYFRRGRDEAVLILECEDEAQAEANLSTLPLVANGLITFEIIPLRPYPGFERLLKG